MQLSRTYLYFSYLIKKKEWKNKVFTLPRSKTSVDAQSQLSLREVLRVIDHIILCPVAQPDVREDLERHETDDTQ